MLLELFSNKSGFSESQVIQDLLVCQYIVETGAGQETGNCMPPKQDLPYHYL